MARVYGKQQKFLMALAGVSLVYFAYSYFKENYYQRPNRKELFVATCIDVLALDVQGCKDFMNKYGVFIDR
ncbi:MAG: hypothetical protein HRU09_09745 [Oligoflexales bacterium]|nr:hypothetical protein [Oligoflexales bacterium]